MDNDTKFIGIWVAFWVALLVVIVSLATGCSGLEYPSPEDAAPDAGYCDGVDCSDTAISRADWSMCCKESNDAIVDAGVLCADVLSSVCIRVQR